MKKKSLNTIYSLPVLLFIIVTSVLFFSFKTNETIFYNSNPEYKVIGCDTTIIYFKQQVLPILQTKCIMCHNPEKNSHGVLLNNYENILATIETDDDDDDEQKNELAKVILRNKMPPYPHEKLSSNQKNILLKWVNQGMQNNSCEETLIATSNLTFENSLKLVIENHCIGCHSGKSPANGYDFSNKNTVLEVVKNGKLLKAINHEAGVTPMPFMSDKISENEINAVRTWIENGMN